MVKVIHRGSFVVIHIENKGCEAHLAVKKNPTEVGFYDCDDKG